MPLPRCYPGQHRQLNAEHADVFMKIFAYFGDDVGPVINNMVCEYLYPKRGTQEAAEWVDSP